MSDRPAFPRPYSVNDECEKEEAQTGMTLREYMVIKFAAAWVSALSDRDCEPGYTDIAALHEANRLAIQQADDLLKRMEGEMTPEERIDANIDKVLRAGGSALKYHTMQLTLDRLRNAMREIMSESYIVGANDARHGNGRWKNERPY